MRQAKFISTQNVSRNHINYNENHIAERNNHVYIHNW